MNKELVKRAYVAAWQKSRGCESYSDHEIRTAENCFEEWWNVNGPDEGGFVFPNE